jgi:predicted Zn-dependent protease
MGAEQGPIGLGVEADPQLQGRPWDFEGMPLGRQVWIENGVLKQLIYSRFWGKKQGKTPTGGPSTFKMAGCTQSMDDLVKSTTRGILVTRLWYLREVDPRTILFTGLTRDGTFLIENGRVTRPVKNLRYIESPIFMLNNVMAMGRSERVSASEAGGPGQAISVPAMKVRDFTFTSTSDAI